MSTRTDSELLHELRADIARQTAQIQGLAEAVGKLSVLPERVTALETTARLLKGACTLLVALWAAVIGHLGWKAV